MGYLLTNTDRALRHGWHPVALSSEVGGEPLQVSLLGEPWVVARLDDQLSAFADRCPHRLAPLSAGTVVGSELVCAYHGWRFVASGECTAVPALGDGVPAPRRARAQTAWGVTERYGLIWITPDEPVCDLIDLPEASDASFATGWLAPARTSACAGLLADNFLDVAHLPFVHTATIGAAEAPDVAPYTVATDDDGFRVEMDQTFSNPEDPAVATGTRPLVQRRRSAYVYRPPFMMRLRLDYLDADGTNTLLFALQPETADSTRIYTAVLRNDLGGDAARLADAVAFEQSVLDEDLALQERFTVRGLPLDAEDEVSIRPDAAGLALRRLLAALVRRGARQARTAPPRRPGPAAVLAGTFGAPRAARRP